MELLAILFLYKLYADINIFKLTEIRDIDGHCMPQVVTYLMSPW